MPTQMPVAGALPTGNALAVCLHLFLSAMAIAASKRAERSGPVWIVEMAQVYREELGQHLSGDEMATALAEFDERDIAALTGLQVEMVYYARRHAPELFDGLDEPDLLEIQHILQIVSQDDQDDQEADSVREGEVIKGSVDFLLSKLPGWLRRLVDVIFQALKISRGAY